MSSSRVFSRPCPKNGNYDVFLSFRGKDTRHGFTSNLYYALMDNEVYTFMDIKLVGKVIDDLFEIIRISKIAVVVYSKTFASSDWCLRELETILQRMKSKEKKMLVIPIFYNVGVHELKHLTGETGEYLNQHIQNYDETTVQKWKNAVTTLGNISGISYKSDRYEHGFIKEVIATIKDMLEEWEENLERSNKPYSSGPATEQVKVEDENEESIMNQQAHVSLAKLEENTQALALQTGEKELVLTLDHSNFYETISKHDFVLVQFYSPWIEYCNVLAQQYEKAASILSITHPRIILAKVDVNEDANEELANEHVTDGSLGIKIFRDGGKIVYTKKGLVDAEDIVEYLTKQSGRASAEIKSAEDAIGLVGDNSLVVVGVFPKFSGEEYNNFIALAERLKSDYDFAHTQDAKLLPRGDPSVSGPLVRLFKPFDELFVDSKDFNVEALEKFVEESSLPVLTVYNNDPTQLPYVTKFFINQNAKVVLFMNFSNEVAESMKAKYREVAEQFKGQDIIFLLADLEFSQGIFEHFELKEEQVPVIVVNSNRKNYLKANIKVDDIAPWVRDYKDGKVAPCTKSEPIPHDNSEPVKVVVGDSIDDVVFKSGKNVLIEFYAPESPQCQMFAPILEEVALSFESDPSIVIAKFDETANDITSDAFDVNGYPTLYFRSSTGTILEYDGDRTKENIIDFIQKNRVRNDEERKHENEA